MLSASKRNLKLRYDYLPLMIKKYSKKALKRHTLSVQENRKDDTWFGVYTIFKNEGDSQHKAKKHTVLSHLQTSR